MKGILHHTIREIVEGLRAGLSSLLWGHPYPRRVNMSQLAAIRRKR